MLISPEQSDFHFDLNNQERWWKEFPRETLLKKIFPTMVRYRENKNRELQNKGIDQIIVLPKIGKIYVEEKIVFHQWQEILLEYLSNAQKGTPGWIEKDLWCDYLIYAFFETKTAYVIKWKELKALWDNEKEALKKIYPPVGTPNYNGNNSVCAKVPIDLLQKKLGSNMIKYELNYGN
jgi:hypothetical protein